MASYSLFNPRWMTGEYHPRVVAYYYREWKGFFMPFHSHNQVEIMYVIRGKCRVEVENVLQTALKKGDVILLDAQVPHRLLVEKDSPCRMLNIEFIFAPAQGLCPPMNRISRELEEIAFLCQCGQSCIVWKDAEDIYYLLKAIVEELDESGKHDGLMTDMLLAQLLVRLGRMERQRQAEDAANIHVRKADQYMRSRYDCDIRVEDIAAAVNVHPSYLHRIFKAHTHQTLIEYLTGIRLQKAKMLLAHTDIPIIEISDYVGINSRQYFSTLFKKNFGVTPKEYRSRSEIHSKKG